MAEAAQLQAALNVFATIIDELAAIAARNDPGRRSELIAARRRLADHITALRTTGAAAFVDPAIADEFRARLSKVQSVVAMHQAKWSAVAIDEGQAAYRQSAAAAATGNRAFIDWTRAALARDR